MENLTAKEIKILKIARNLKQVERLKDGASLFRGHLYYVRPCELTIAHDTKELEPICKAEKLVKLCTIETSHSLVGYKGDFRPFLKEVFEQIPEEYLEEAVAFRVEPSWHMRGDKDGGRVTLYKLKDGQKVPNEVKNQDVIYNGTKYSANVIDEMTNSK